jgi:hypothetical protein
MVQTKKHAEYAHVLTGTDGTSARFQLVFGDGRPVEEFQIPVSQLDKQRATICDGFVKEMRKHGIRGPEQYRFVDQTLREFRRGEGVGGYTTVNAGELGAIQRGKYESYIKSSLMEGKSKAA